MGEVWSIRRTRFKERERNEPLNLHIDWHNACADFRAAVQTYITEHRDGPAP